MCRRQLLRQDLPLPPTCERGFARIGELIATVGLERVGAPHVRHLTGPLWETRFSGRDGIPLALYVAAKDRRIVLVREIEVALRRAGEVSQ